MLPPLHVGKTLTTGQDSEKMGKHLRVDAPGIIGGLDNRNGMLHPIAKTDPRDKSANKSRKTSPSRDWFACELDHNLTYTPR